MAQKFTKQTDLETMGDKKSQEGMPSHEYNNSKVGLPFSGSGKGAECDGPKYDMFGSEDIGEHFGRSGSPKGSSPRV